MPEHNERLTGIPRWKWFGDEPTILEVDWEFIEKYYPDYSHCDDIALHNDFEKILHEEDEEGSEATRILREWYEGNRESAVLYDDYQELSIRIMTKAINNFMETNQ